VNGIATSLLDTREALEIPLFKIDRRKFFVETMPTFWIVEYLDVVEDILPSLGTGCVGLLTDAFTIYELEGAFSHSVIVAIPAPAPALLQIVGIKEIAPVVTAELTPLVGVHRILRLRAPDGHQQCM
jgi:hypothetical protein